MGSSATTGVLVFVILVLSAVIVGLIVATHNSTASLYYCPADDNIALFVDETVTATSKLGAVRICSNSETKLQYNNLARVGNCTVTCGLVKVSAFFF